MIYDDSPVEIARLLMLNGYSTRQFVKRNGFEKNCLIQAINALMEFVTKFVVILGQSAWSKTSEKKRKKNAI